MPANLGQLFLFGQDVLSAGLDPNSTTNTIVAQIGDASTGVVTGDNCEWMQTAGLASIPSSPTTNGRAAQCVAIRQGDRDVIIGCRDLRASTIYGNLKPGETCLYGGGVDGSAQGRVLIKQNGSVSLATTDDNTSTGNAVFLRVSPDQGLEFVSPWGTLAFGPMGLKIRVGAAGPEIRAYIMSPGLPGPLQALQSYVSIKGSIVKLDGTMVLLGPDSPAATYEPVVWSPDPPGAPALIKGINSMCLKVSVP